MSYYVSKMPRPYDYHGLIEAYVRTRRTFIHDDFGTYYNGLTAALERAFGVRLATDELTFTQKVFWMLFSSTVESLLRIGTPWSGYIEDSLIHTKLQGAGATGGLVYEQSRKIDEATKASTEAHYRMLSALFVLIFGERSQVVTSEELLARGFDDSKEPDISNYWEHL